GKKRNLPIPRSKPGIFHERRAKASGHWPLDRPVHGPQSASPHGCISERRLAPCPSNSKTPGPHLRNRGPLARLLGGLALAAQPPQRRKMKTTYASPVGKLYLSADARGLTGLYW